VEFYEITEELIPILLKLFQKELKIKYFKWILWGQHSLDRQDTQGLYNKITD
jgi:hypothetical protein